MTYALGIDLGTTYTAAAVARNGRAEVAALGYRATSVPSVVLLTEDGRFLVGDAAERRAANEPNRVAREFKRRVGDPTPLLLGGTPVAVDRCLAEILRWVATTVGETEGGPPDSVTVTHPANWGEFKQDVLREALRLADLPQSRLLAEPVAAATWYAQSARLQAGHVVAVYDLGGGTFDAAILRQGPDGTFENLGRAEGIERLGGIDIDQAVLGFVLRALGDDGARLADEDDDDPATRAALTQLRRACVEAKEALSSETSVTIPVWLPGLHHEVLMHRTELEELVTPLLQPTVDALGRVVRSTGLRAADVHSVLLVGGSSRIPLIARQVSAGFGRPIAVDAHPKHPVALGAALDALHHLEAAPPAVPEPWLAAPLGAPAARATTGPAPAPVAAPPLRPFSPGPPPPPRPVGQNEARRTLVGVGVAAVVILLAVLGYVLVQPSDDDPEVDTASDTSLGQLDESSDTSAEPEGEPEDDPEAPADDPGPIDLFLGDSRPAFDAFAAINGGSPVITAEIVLYPDDARATIQKVDQPEYFDDYTWEGGEATFYDETLIPPTEDELAEGVLFDVTEVDPALIPTVVQDATTRCPGDGFEVSHVIISKFTPFEDQVMIKVYISNPERSTTGGFVTFTLAGAFVENNCE